MVKISNEKIIIEFAGTVEDFVQLKEAMLNITISAQGNPDSRLSGDTALVLMMLRHMELNPRQINTETKQAA